MTYLNLWYIVKAVLREKFIAMSAYIKRKDIKINDKNKQIPKTSRRRQIIKIRAKNQ
jgi:hypothetical protein